jgi:hypothetical protein
MVGAMTQTSPAALLRIAFAGSLIGWLFDSLWQSIVGTLFRWGWGSPASMLIASLTLGAWSWAIHNRLPRRIKNAKGEFEHQRALAPLSPLVAARTAALAFAGSRTGAAVGGFYLGCAAFARFETEAAANHSWTSLLTSIFSLVLVVISLWLERRCQLPPDIDATEKQSA